LKKKTFKLNKENKDLVLKLDLALHEKVEISESIPRGG